MTPRALFAIVGLLSVSWGCGGSPVSPAAAKPPSNAPNAPVPVLLTYSGTVRAVDGGPLEGVRVTVNRSGSASVLTDASGSYLLVEAPGNLVFVKAGYIPSGIRTPSIQTSTVTINAKLQASLIVKSNAPVSGVISPDDLTYSSDMANSFDPDGGYYYCSPCKEISVPSSRGRLRLSWTGSIPLDLWLGSYYIGVIDHYVGRSTQQELTVDVPGGNVDTLLVGLGTNVSIEQPIAFKLTFESAE